MLLKRILLLILSFCAGAAVSAGSFAFLIVIGVIPRLLRRAQINHKIILVENVIILGTIFGCIMSLWERDIPSSSTASALLFQAFDSAAAQMPKTVSTALLAGAAEIAASWPIVISSAASILSGIGHFLIALYGISSGIFVGGIAVSLAEILHTFPIIFRRFHLTEGLSWLMCAMAIGKVCGALFSFYGGYWY